MVVALALIALGTLNHLIYPRLFWLGEMKGHPIEEPVLVDRWNSHSRVTASAAQVGEPYLWGAGAAVPHVQVEQILLQIDGKALTACTRFDGDARTLDWLRYDLTTLAYSIRGRGEVAVVGVGGGRDVLAAIGAGTRHVTGIEINDTFLRLLDGQLREFAGLAGFPGVSLVHADGRAYLAATPDRYDLIQIALVDTWASASAGAMTLTENGLYTVESWKTFLSRLRPGGVLAVSRWYSPGTPGETARLLALATSALHASGIRDVRRHVVLAATHRLANLILARDPLAPADLGKLRDEASRYHFAFLVFPGQAVADPLLAGIVAARNEAQLRAATDDPTLILAAPTDDSPFFFNMLRPSASLRLNNRRGGGVIDGNLRATETVVVIFGAVLFLVVATILVPLLARRRPWRRQGGWIFACGATYFSLIGTGF
ncbi:MAG TPA: hypothetical protein VN970_01235, partial [Thermoanaerobaculia bacterium]|nr:hypothetical protein [Thermoanaerobaculia bacterium]